MNILNALARLWSKGFGGPESSNAPPGAPSNPAIVLSMADLTGRDSDAIVNAADWTMLGGTGVDGAIHAKAGPELGRFVVSRKLRLETAQVHATPGFNLLARHILHTCAPTYEGCLADRDAGREALRLCYRACVERADAMGLESVSFPLLGAGAFHWPLSQAAEQCALALRDAAGRCHSLKLIEVCAFGQGPAEALAAALGVEISESASPASLAYHPGASALDGLSADEIAARF